MTPADTENLITRAADGTITPPEAEELLRLCKSDQELLKRLTSELIIERLLHAVERDPDGKIAARELVLRLEQERIAAVSDVAFVPRVVERARHRTWRSRWAIAAALVFIAGTVALLTHEGGKGSTEEPFAMEGPLTKRLPATGFVAVLKRSVDVIWDGSSRAPGVGTMLESGWIRTRSGTIQLEFLGGARLLVSGPAELRLESENEAFLQSGRVSAFVPRPARGFTLKVPGMDIVDHGTAFGVISANSDGTEVHVFDGSVSLRLPNQAPREVVSGSAIRLIDGKMQKIEVAPSSFQSGEELENRAETAGQKRFASWRSANESLAADPATLLSYTFDIDNEWSRTITNQGFQAITESHGAIVGAGWITGRWPSKRALEFRSLGDRLRFTLPGRYEKISLLAWVRVDSLPNDYNSLILPTRYENGALHWTLERGGELRLTMLTDTKRPFTPGAWDGPVSGTAVTSMDFGRWLLLTTTYDSTTGLVSHYRDGQLAGQAKFTKKMPAVLGPVEFGNWGADATTPDNAWVTRQQPNYRLRNFVGRLDELAILARVLSPEEIASLYEAGKP